MTSATLWLSQHAEHVRSSMTMAPVLHLMHTWRNCAPALTAPCKLSIHNRWVALMTSATLWLSQHAEHVRSSITMAPRLDLMHAWQSCFSALTAPSKPSIYNRWVALMTSATLWQSQHAEHVRSSMTMAPVLHLMHAWQSCFSALTAPC